MNFREWFCLKDRDSFTIDPKINPGDARFYFGRSEIKEQLTAQIRRAFVDPGIPKVFIYGTYGSGKTQTLYHLEHYLHTQTLRSLQGKPRTVHVVVEMGSKSNHLDWHLQLMEALGKETVVSWVETLFSKVGDLDKSLNGLFGDHNLVQAVKNLRGGGDPPLLAWRWLSGQRIAAGELQRLQLTRNLGDIGAGDMVNVLVGLGRLAEKNGEKLIYLMDELEEFRDITNPDAVESVHSYLRRLAEPWNSSVGFIISQTAITPDDMAEIFTRRDVMTRIGANNYVDIPPLPTVQDVRLFLSEMLAELIDREAAEKRIQEQVLTTTLETYPMDADAFDMICEYATQDPTKSLPRNIIKTLNECAISAWDSEKPVVKADVVNEIAPLVFG